MIIAAVLDKRQQFDCLPVAEVAGVIYDDHWRYCLKFRNKNNLDGNACSRCGLQASKWKNMNGVLGVH